MNAPVEFPVAGHPVDNDAARLLEVQRAAFLKDMNPSREVRIARLDKLAQMVERHTDEFCAAIVKDYGVRDNIVTHIGDITPTLTAIRHAKKHLGKWMRLRRASVELSFRPASAKIMMQPLGVVGIIGPWNYPLQLLLCPLVAAFAAGNRALLKPSELTPTFSDVLKARIAETFPEDEVAVITGGPEIARAFSELPFDHLVFTGSTAVGRLVAQAAAKNLTPVTLELGGKSPVIVDATADLKTTAARITWGKLFNAGQTCIAPDYALVPRDKVAPFVDALRAAVAKQYPTVNGNPDYTNIISARHFERLNTLVSEARAAGAEVVDLAPTSKQGPAPASPDARTVAPTVLLNVKPEMAVMKEEIFGPVFPVLPYDSPEEAVRYVNAHDRPLALYWFGADNDARDKVLSQTISGGVTVNDTLIHVVQESIPFGGVGPSGQGQYHGVWGFNTLSKAKPIVYQSKFSGLSMVYPPYKGFTRRVVSMLQRFA